MSHVQAFQTPAGASCLAAFIRCTLRPSCHVTFHYCQVSSRHSGPMHRIENNVDPVSLRGLTRSSVRLNSEYRESIQEYVPSLGKFKETLKPCERGVKSVGK